MPIITIYIKQGRSEEQKAQLVKEITEVTSRVLNTQKEKIVVAIVELPDTNIGRAGVLLSREKP
ncbi:MAG: 4-oxalocrotonate tautomerase family protein [Thaumarchaeota archaeon]|nr:4-oxalocrotonate tautomerase family protein [Nitrososphaerota archaeon]